MGEHPNCIYKAIAFKVPVRVVIYTICQRLLHWSNFNSNLHALSMCDALTHMLIGSCVYHFSRKSDHQCIQKYRFNRTEEQKYFSYVIHSTRCFNTVFKPKLPWLPDRQHWCQRPYSTPQITGSFCLQAQCQNMSGSSLLGVWDKSVKLLVPASSHILCFLKEQCLACSDTTLNQ